MNSEFLKVEFSNKVFVTYYMEFFEKLEDQFESENNDKIEKFTYTITSAWLTNNLSLI